MIAWTPRTLKSPSTSAGVRPAGLIAINSGVREPPLTRSTISILERDAEMGGNGADLPGVGGGGEIHKAS